MAYVKKKKVEDQGEGRTSEIDVAIRESAQSISHDGVKGVREKKRDDYEKRCAAVFGEGDFEGDAYEMLSRVYKSPVFGVQARIKCAEVCIQYERPKLISTKLGSDEENPITIVNDIMVVLNGTGRGLPNATPQIETSRKRGGSDDSTRFLQGSGREIHEEEDQGELTPAE